MKIPKLSIKFKKPTQRQLSKVLASAGIIVFALSGIVFAYQKNSDPETVFWGALDNALQTKSISAEFVTDNGQKSESFSQISYGPVPTVQVVNKTYDSGDKSVPVSVTQNIGTKETDYLRFIKYQPQTGSISPDQASGIENVWTSKTVLGDEASNLLYNQYVYTFSTSFPLLFGDLNSKDRKELLALLRKDAISITPADTVSVKSDTNRKTYGYTVTVNIAPYIEALKKYGKVTDYKLFEMLESERFTDARPLMLEISVDVLSKQITGLQSNGVVVKYPSHGLVTPVNIFPSETITSEELQKRQESIQ